MKNYFFSENREKPLIHYCAKLIFKHRFRTLKEKQQFIPTIHNSIEQNQYNYVEYNSIKVSNFSKNIEKINNKFNV